jgi:hypothetical protein
VLPKLAVHGLSENEPVPGAKYRRSFLNKRGLAVLAELDSRSIRRKKKKRDEQLKGATDATAPGQKPAAS